MMSNNVTHFDNEVIINLLDDGIIDFWTVVRKQNFRRRLLTYDLINEAYT